METNNIEAKTTFSTPPKNIFRLKSYWIPNIIIYIFIAILFFIKIFVFHYSSITDITTAIIVLSITSIPIISILAFLLNLGAKKAKIQNLSYDKAFFIIMSFTFPNTILSLFGDGYLIRFITFLVCIFVLQKMLKLIYGVNAKTAFRIFLWVFLGVMLIEVFFAIVIPIFLQFLHK